MSATKPPTDAQAAAYLFVEVHGKPWAESPLGGKGAAKLFLRGTE
jgi:hypothetical protein